MPFELSKDQSISKSISVNHSSQNRQPLWHQFSTPSYPFSVPFTHWDLAQYVPFPVPPTPAHRLTQPRSLSTNHIMEIRPVSQYLLVGFNGSDIRWGGCILWGSWSRNNNSNSEASFAELILTTVSGSEQRGCCFQPWNYYRWCSISILKCECLIIWLVLYSIGVAQWEPAIPLKV